MHNIHFQHEAKNFEGLELWRSKEINKDDVYKGINDSEGLFIIPFTTSTIKSTICFWNTWQIYRLNVSHPVSQ